MQRHGVLQSMVPAGLTSKQALEQHNSSENGTRRSTESKNFSQVGGWVLHGYQGRNSMYTRDREGIVEDIATGSTGKQDPQVASCMKHLLFGHGTALADVCPAHAVQEQRLPNLHGPRHPQQS
jgi:hypothetical protein